MKVKKQLIKPIEPKEIDFLMTTKEIYVYEYTSIQSIIDSLPKDIDLKECKIKLDYDGCYYDGDIPDIKVQYSGKMPLDEFEEKNYKKAIRIYEKLLAKYNKENKI